MKSNTKSKERQVKTKFYEVDYMAANKSLKKIPDNEICMVTHKCSNGDTYKITQNKTNKLFTIYEVVNNCFVRLGKGYNPIELEEKYIKNKD